MTTNRNDRTTGSAGPENPWYPRHASDRADELLDELDEVQQVRLYGALKTRAFGEWLRWLEETRESIAEYDGLGRSQRRRRLRDRPDTETLMLHHACVYIELWRARIQREYFCFPPSGPDLDTPQAQREMMLQVMTAFDDADPRDLWPFDHPDSADVLPFRSDS